VAATKKAAERKKKKGVKNAFQDSTKHNATTTTKSKKQKVESTKKAPTTKKSTTKKSKKDEWEHDEHYMKMITEGFPNYGHVSPDQHYYICNSGDSYYSIAEKVGCDRWQAFNDVNLVEFNVRFYGVLKGTQRFQRG